jgi:hypothetical protein
METAEEEVMDISVHHLLKLASAPPFTELFAAELFVVELRSRARCLTLYHAFLA